MTKSEASGESGRRRARVVRGGLSVLFVVVGVGAAGVILGTKPEPPRDETAESPLVVRSMTTAPTRVRRTHRGYGVASAAEAVDVSAEVEGVVTEKPARLDEGVRVDRGELLVRIDPSDYADQLARLERRIEGVESELAQLEVEAEGAAEQAALAEEALGVIAREIERLRGAESRGAATANEIDQQVRARIAVARELVTARERLSGMAPRRLGLESRLAVLRTEASLAERDLSRSAVESPIAGVVQSVDVEVGERVRVGDRIARVVDPRRIETPLRLAVSAGSHVRVGDSAVLRADGPGGGEWRGRVARIAPEADATTRTMTVYVEVVQDAPDGRAAGLAPGRFVLGDVEAGEETLVIVPRGAVSGDRVLVVGPGGEVESRPVVVGFYLEGEHAGLVPGETQWAAIESGLRGGEVVAVSNLSKLRNGMRVEATGVAP